ncbi:MAG: cell wall hydrolase [Erythrobacter sp.]|jgi:spore germination cell wall hydrolase CwlJ-like protein|nr:cell wall hydrolase [Erythrobacter sp.]
MSIFRHSLSRGGLAFTSLLAASAMAAPTPTAKGALGASVRPDPGKDAASVAAGGLGEIVVTASAANFRIAPATPFAAGYGDAASPGRAVECLAQAVYYEGATEPASGQQAIAQVVLNRVSHPAFPNTVCGVVYEGSQRATGCQFTFTCDGSLARRPASALWARARRTAKAALGGFVSREVGRATHYHADYVDPYWSGSLDRIDQVGTHIFYVWRGKAGEADAFSMDYAGVEPDTSAFEAAAQVAPEPEPVPAPGKEENALDAETQAVRVDPEPAQSEAVAFNPRPLLLAE